MHYDNFFVYIYLYACMSGYLTCRSVLRTMIFSTETNRSTSVLGCWLDPPAAAFCSEAFCCFHTPPQHF